MQFNELPADPYMYLPDENKKWAFVLQAHIRGKSVHGDLRFQVTKDTLVGWTLNWIKRLDKVPKNMTEAREMIEKQLPKAFDVLLDPHIKTVTEKKAPEPVEWLHVEAWFPPGTVGATRYLPGAMIIVDKGQVEFLAQKPAFHEYQIWGKNLAGRIVVRQLPNVWRKKSLESGEPEKTGRGLTVWMSFFSDPMPYVLTKRAVEKKWYPPEGKSCLPAYIRRQIPPKLRYWKKKGKEAHRLRDELVAAIANKTITIKFLEPQEDMHKASEPEEYMQALPTPNAGVMTRVIEEVSSHYPALSIAADFAKYYWVCRGDEKTCPNCRWLTRHSPYKLSELPCYPRSGHTLCGEHCRCHLMMKWKGVYYPLFR